MMKLLFKLLKKLKMNQIGSGLIQIPITATIIGGLSIAGTSLADVLPEARDTRRAADAYQVSQALALYYDDVLTYPVFTGTDSELSWKTLGSQLEYEYIFEFPQDPSADSSYRYWSDGQQASVFWISEVDGQEHERRLF